jgi:hypothetical protein
VIYALNDDDLLELLTHTAGVTANSAYHLFISGTPFILSLGGLYIMIVVHDHLSDSKFIGSSGEWTYRADGVLSVGD